MNFLDIWDKPELFEKYDFSEIDRKIKYIQENRYTDTRIDDVIKELNNRVDIDFIKDSELLEGNVLKELESIKFEEDYKDIFSDASLKDIDLLRQNDDFCFGKYRTITRGNNLIIYKKQPQSDKVKKFVLQMPAHLKTLEKLFTRARKDRLEIRQGRHPKLTTEFIEKVHENLFESFIQLNLRLGKNGEIIRPEGYGKFRRTVERNGKLYKVNLEVEGAKWQPSDSDDVRKEMEALLEKYNNSTLHPIIKAILFKTCFIKIHPFRDGNGRTSRLLLNYLLIRNGIPTVTIRGNHKEEYLSAMANAITDNNFDDIMEIAQSEILSRCDQYQKVISVVKENENKDEDENETGDDESSL